MNYQRAILIAACLVGLLVIYAPYEWRAPNAELDYRLGASGFQSRHREFLWGAQLKTVTAFTSPVRVRRNLVADQLAIECLLAAAAALLLSTIKRNPAAGLLARLQQYAVSGYGLIRKARPGRRDAARIAILVIGIGIMGAIVTIVQLVILPNYRYGQQLREQKNSRSWTWVSPSPSPSTLPTTLAAPLPTPESPSEWLARQKAEKEALDTAAKPKK